MSDLIDRQAAIDALEEPCKVSDTWTDEYAIGERMQWEKDVKTLTSLPSAQPEQRWIPVTERLPKPFEHCLWTTTDGRVVYHHCDGLFSNYTAWMPLPEPYAERRTDEL